MRGVPCGRFACSASGVTVTGQSMEERNMSWLQTFTGRRIDLFHPDPRDIDIIDIAHALSHECRYAGHVKTFFSVAQHSVLVSEYCDGKDALWGLLHDASEAYLGDVVKPLKVSGAFRQYRILERRMQAAVCSRFGLPMKEPRSVQQIDKAMVAIEARDLLAPLHPDWRELNCTLALTIRPETPEQACRTFLERYCDLTGELTLAFTQSPGLLRPGAAKACAASMSEGLSAV